MGLKGSYNFGGLDVPQAYVGAMEVRSFKQVNSIGLPTAKTMFAATVKVFVNDTKAKVLEVLPINGEYNLTSSDNIYKQAYAALKLITKFKGMVDVA